MNLQALVRNTAASFGGQTAFQIKREGSYQKWSFTGVEKEVLSLSAYLVSLGIKKGDRVAIFSENCPEWAVSYLAVASMSAVAVPLDIMLSREEVLPLLQDCEAKAVILSSRGKERIGESGIVEIRIEDRQPTADSRQPTAEEPNENDLAAIIYTSGTTGAAKGVMLTHNNIMSNVSAIARVFKVGPGDNFLSVLPMHHTFETTAGFLGPYYMGACITYTASLKSHHLLSAMQETGTTVMCGVPMLYQLFYDGLFREIKEKGWPARIFFWLLQIIADFFPSQSAKRKIFFMLHKKFGGKIRFWVSGGAAIDPEIILGFENFGIAIIQGYGLTESSPILACNTLENNKIGSVGRALPGVEIGFTREGELIARGPNIMQGYYKRPDLTAEVLKDGWLYTGDIGRRDPDGFIYITGRSKDVIITGSGVNVYPDEIEFLLKKIKGVKEACVVGSKIKEGVRIGSEEVVAVLVPEEGMEIEEDEVFALNARLAEHKRIARAIIRDGELPKTTTRKIKKYQLKKEMDLL